MPTLNLLLCPPQPAELRRQLAQALTDITARTLAKRAEVTAVLIDERQPAQWFIGGRTPTKPTALLDISITAGTNTAEQKAAFIQQAHALLAEVLGEAGALEEASYVVVHELPAGDWGYDGRTQLARQALRLTARP